MKPNIIYFVTTNDKKVERLVDALKRRDVSHTKIIQRKINLPEPRSEEVWEITDSKARFAYNQLRGPCIVQDSGFFINSLKGFPRTFINFTLDTIGLEGIMNLTLGKDRACSFRHCLTYINRNLVSNFYSESHGTLAGEERGRESEWVLHRVFIPHGSTKTIAEMSPREMEDYRDSRAKDYYTAKFARWLKTGVK